MLLSRSYPLTLLAFLLAFPGMPVAAKKPVALGDLPRYKTTEPPLIKPRDSIGVKLRGLNKVTARSSVFIVPLKESFSFGDLEIIAHTCWESVPEARPETAAFLQIRQPDAPDGREDRFLGWMFASSPGLSALEDPVYDITVLACARKGGIDGPKKSAPPPDSGNP